ncbi:hypothetical protein BDZ90DRAFT_72544 [Jaminaea rosea]|uniref:Uncharacterized protein n=1 Tax=Jaminaea rosea TaxID=1569628 RepID=A0A316UJB1_9BASI|nr:hypothetical protein BDZ90DRAFT_72544 [Jaminaea rosea]PWN25310.1 hypothetical protein BDZ90DRAFT_72544 [Jaminaea rosea]
MQVRSDLILPRREWVHAEFDKANCTGRGYFPASPCVLYRSIGLSTLHGRKLLRDVSCPCGQEDDDKVDAASKVPLNPCQRSRKAKPTERCDAKRYQFQHDLPRPCLVIPMCECERVNEHYVWLEACGHHHPRLHQPAIVTGETRGTSPRALDSES